MVSHIIRHRDWMKPLGGNTSQEIENFTRSLMLKLWLGSEEGAVIPHRKDLMSDSGTGIEKTDHIFPTNSPDEEREGNCLQKQNLSGFFWAKVIEEKGNVFHDQQCL